VSEVAVREGILNREGLERTPNSLHLPADLAPHEYQELIWALGEGRKRFSWWLADALAGGEKMFGEDWAGLIEECGLSEGGRDNLASLARNIPPSRRNKNVDISHHKEVQPLPPDEQVRWLREAEVRGLSRDQLRAEIRAAQNGHPDILEPQPLSLQEAAHAVWHSSRRMVGDAFVTPAEPMLQLRFALGE
jgi:hypothetical protein